MKNLRHSFTSDLSPVFYVFPSNSEIIEYESEGAAKEDFPGQPVFYMDDNGNYRNTENEGVLEININ